MKETLGRPSFLVMEKKGDSYLDQFPSRSSSSSLYCLSLRKAFLKCDSGSKVSCSGPYPFHHTKYSICFWAWLKQCPRILSTSYSISLPIAHRSFSFVCEFTLSLLYQVRCSMFMTGCICSSASKWRQYTMGLIFSITRKGPILHCSNFCLVPFMSTRSSKWGLTRTSSPTVNSSEW